MKSHTSAVLDRLVMDAARPVEPLSVSFAPASSGDWSVSVMVEDMVPSARGHERNGRPSFREEPA